jgi:hypothetical protein
MTHKQTLAAFEGFRGEIEGLSREQSDDRNFWPACAGLASEVEAGSPPDFRDYVRYSILRTMDTIRRSRE